MRRRSQHWHQSKNAKARRENLIQRSLKGVAAKARLREANPIEHEPEMVPFLPLQFGVRDKLSGDEAWVDLRSCRDAAKRIAVILRYYEPGKRKLA